MMRQTPLESIAHDLLSTGIISEEEHDRLIALNKKRERIDVQRMQDSNRRADERYEKLPRWRKLLNIGGREDWIARHRDYWPL